MEGVLSEKALGCMDSEIQRQAQSRLSTNNDWLPAAGLVLAGRCWIFDPGDKWRMVERGFERSLVYVTKDGVPHRAYVPNSKLR